MYLALAMLALAIGVATAARAWQATPPARGVFVGRVGGTNAFLAIAIGRGQARAYLCDSQQLAAWLPPASLHGGHLDLTGDGLQVRGRIRRGGAQGTVTLADGTRHPFRAARAPAGGAAGLYRATTTVHGSRNLAGWILLSAHAQRGNTTRFSNPLKFEVGAAPPLHPEATSVEITEGSVATVVRFTALGIPDND